MLNLKSFKQFVKDKTATVKSVWTDLKSKIKGLFSKKLAKAKAGDVVKVTIPVKTEVDLSEDALQSIQGNYNEALLLLMIYNYKGAGVDIAKKYSSKYYKDIVGTVKKWAKDLKVAAKDFKKSENIIKQGSQDMARYLVNEALENDSTIIGGYLDNLSFQRGGIASKADIQIFVRKDGKEELQGYSLKLYTSKSVGLANSTAVGIARHLGGDAAAKKVESEIAKDKRLNAMIDKAKKLDKIKQALKALGKDGNKRDNAIKRLEKLGYSKKAINGLDVGKIEAERKEARKPINPRVAEIIYRVIKPLSKTPEFGQNILKVIGFTDKETKMLMSVVKDNKGGMKSSIIDSHPDLDVTNIKLELSGVSLNIKGPTGKTIITFGVKEGEKKSVSGKVSFAGVDEYDLANAPIFSDK
tara:strand:- start:1339 stop:2574 length:1236 start_codon:yes stop_codon:yes gene_type:complete